MCSIPHQQQVHTTSVKVNKKKKEEKEEEDGDD
jgi:hypothetical protein